LEIIVKNVLDRVNNMSVYTLLAIIIFKMPLVCYDF